ncbi:class I SAM-dependent methyltransferase [Pandoraea pulmonicola]|nr:class I SAM-dependent methyltransferase [Pandoraea pulmonicola]
MNNALAPDPLHGIHSIDALLSLPYFEILACLGGGSLHPGGGAGTQLLLDACALKQSDHVLEVGCGPGWTTRALIKAGVPLATVERSRRMLDAMQFHCGAEGLSPPLWANSSIEAFSGFEGRTGRFDLAILECVIGFVDDKVKMVDAVVDQLVPRGRIGVLDVHYVEPPPESTLNALREVTGHTIIPLKRHDWETLFGRLTRLQFQEFKLPDSSHDSGRRIVAASGIGQRLPGASAEDLRRLEEHLDRVGAVFNENKRYLLGHIAVWQLPS